MPFQHLLHVLSPGFLAPWTGLVRDVYTRTLERQSLWITLCVVSLVVLTGFAEAAILPPLTTAHPSHPEAMAAPESSRSSTLVYGAWDVPSPQPAYFMAQRGKEDKRPTTQEGHRTVVGEGKVIAVVPGSSQIVVDHKEIKGFMEAMTMGYKVHPTSLLDGVQADDQVRFTIDTQQKAIVKIEKMK